MSIALKLLLVTLGIAYLTLLLAVLGWILAIKKETGSVLVWAAVVIVIPFLGMLVFVWFGYDRVHRRLRRKIRKHLAYQSETERPGSGADEFPSELARGLCTLAETLDGYPPTNGNHVTLYSETEQSYAEILKLIDSARHHIHLEYYIFQPDGIGKQLIEHLIERRKDGVEVRLLYDSFGSLFLRRGMLRALRDAGGRTGSFLEVSSLWRQYQISLRNHRKLIIIDGQKAMIGGMNIGEEYLGKCKHYGYWRDSNLLIEGPAVASLQHLFIEDWEFATEERMEGEEYYPKMEPRGDELIQIISGGPDQARSTLRGVIYAALTRAKERIWITTPYFVPDAGLIDALQLACRSNVDVRLLIPNRADSWLTWYASRYFLRDLFPEGIKVFQYNHGYLHAKTIVIDDEWAFVGSANFDNRSMHLNFELGCALMSTERVMEVAQDFERDCSNASPIFQKDLDSLPFYKRALENFARLFAPIL